MASGITRHMFMTDHVYRLWSPWHHLRLLLWLYLYPRRYATYRSVVGARRARAAVAWLTNALLWTALLLPVVGILIDPALAQRVLSSVADSAMPLVYNVGFEHLLLLGLLTAWLSASSSGLRHDSLTNLVTTIVSGVLALVLLNVALAHADTPADAAALQAVYDFLLVSVCIISVVFAGLAWRRSPVAQATSGYVMLAGGAAVIGLAAVVAINMLQTSGTVTGDLLPAALPITIAGVLLLRLTFYNYRRLLPVLLLVILSLVGALVTYWMTLAAGSVLPGVLSFAVAAALLVAADNASEGTISVYMIGGLAGMLAGVFSLDLPGLGEGGRLLLGFFPLDALPGMIVMGGLWWLARRVRDNVLDGRTGPLNVALFLLLPVALGLLAWAMLFGGWQSLPAWVL